MPLSSSLTFVLRTVLPVGWALGLPIALLVDVPRELEPGRLFLVAGMVVLLVQSAAWFVRLKDVRADAEGLVVSSGRASARVPWAEVVAIERPWWGRGGFARLRFRTPTRFGSTVVFLMSLGPFTRWRNHAVVQTVNAHLAAAEPRAHRHPRRDDRHV